MGDELHDQSRKVNTEGGSYIENLTIVYRQDAAPVERYLRTILESPNHPWCDYRNLKAHYIDLRGDAVYQHEFGFSLIPTALSWLAATDIDAEPQSVESILDTIKQHGRVALLGNPGAGKSTTLQVLLVDAAEVCLKDPLNNPLPVYLRLGDWPDSVPTLRDWVRQYFADHNVRDVPLARNVLLLLDGLNEMGARDREARVQSIGAFLREYESARVVVTCRQRDYADEMHKEWDLERLVAQPLDDERIQRFIGAYVRDEARARALWEAIQPSYRALASDWLQTLLKLLPSDSDEYFSVNRHLLELARNPYLLTIMVVIYEKHNHLPNNVSVLFHLIVRTRWLHEAGQRASPETAIVRGFTFEEFRNALGSLAFVMLDERRGISIDITEAEMLIQPSVGGRAMELLLTGEACSILTISGSRVRFIHQLMQEYFAALALDWCKSVAELAQGSSFWWWGWRETLKIRAGMSKAARDEIATVYLASLTSENDIVRTNIAAVLGDTGSELAIDPLIAALRDPAPSVRGASAQALGQMRVSSAVEHLIELLSDTAYCWYSIEGHKYVCDLAAEALHKIGTPEARAALREHGFDA